MKFYYVFVAWPISSMINRFIGKIFVVHSLSCSSWFTYTRNCGLSNTSIMHKSISVNLIIRNCYYKSEAKRS